MTFWDFAAIAVSFAAVVALAYLDSAGLALIFLILAATAGVFDIVRR